MSEGWTHEGSRGTSFRYVKDVNNGREYVYVEKPARKMHIPLEDFVEAARALPSTEREEK